jgi:hypothetical protein
MDVLEDIARRVGALRQRPGFSKVFGAEKHRFQLRRHTEEEVALLELHLGVGMPDSFRQFLMEMGSGAGPYYGIWSPDELLENFARIQGYLDEDQPRPSPAKAFGLKINDATEVERRMREETPRLWLAMPWPTDGCVPICYQGCTYWSALITAGECAGTVWDVACNQGTDGEWLPARRPPARLDIRRKLLEIPYPPVFLDWYEAWVEQVEADCQAEN